MTEEEPSTALVPASDEEASLERANEARQHKSAAAIFARSALLTGLCRFVPVPFLDDYLEAKVRHSMVSSLLRLEGRTYRAGHLAPLWEGAEGCMGGCVGFALSLPWVLVVKLVKKIFRWVLFVFVAHEAAVHVGQTLLLGRAIHRLLARGAFPEGAQDEPGLVLRQEARLVRGAFDRAFAGTDLRVLERLLRGVFRQVRGLPRAGAHAVRVMFGGRGTAAESPREMPEGDRSAVESGVAEVEAALEREEVVTFFEEFDLRFDEALRDTGEG